MEKPENTQAKEMHIIGPGLAEVFGSMILDKVKSPTIEQAIRGLNVPDQFKVPLVRATEKLNDLIVIKAEEMGIELYEQSIMSYEHSINPRYTKLLKISGAMFSFIQPEVHVIHEELLEQINSDKAKDLAFSGSFEVNQAHVTYVQLLTIFFGNAILIDKTEDEVLKYLLQKPADKYSSINIQTNFELFAMAGFGAIASLFNARVFPKLLILDEDGRIEMHPKTMKFMRSIGERYSGGCPVTGVARKSSAEMNIISEGLYKFLDVFYKVRKVDNVLRVIGKIKEGLSDDYFVAGTRF